MNLSIEGFSAQNAHKIYRHSAILEQCREYSPEHMYDFHIYTSLATRNANEKKIKTTAS